MNGAIENCDAATSHVPGAAVIEPTQVSEPISSAEVTSASESSLPPERPQRQGLRIVAQRELMVVGQRSMPRAELEHWSQASKDRWPPVGLFFRRSASLAIMRHTAWGQVTAFNKIEQGGLLVGAVYRDGCDIWGEVCGALPVVGDHGTATNLVLSPSLMSEVIADYHVRVAAGEWSEGTGIIGWYHTHPNDLPVFMSGTDMATQRAHFSREWQYALVLNPHKRIIRCFRGEHALECSVLLLSGGEDPSAEPPRLPQESAAAAGGQG